CRFVVGVSEEDDGSGVRGSGVEQEARKRGIRVWRENSLVNSDSQAEEKGEKVGKEMEIKAFMVEEAKEGEKIEAINADEDITPVDVETQVDIGVQLQGRIDDDNAATKDVNAAEPAMFDDKEMAKRLHDEEVKQTAAREKQEKDDLKRAKVLQQQKYQSLKRKPVSIAQARKNMIIYLKNMAGYKMEHFRGMTYNKVKYPLIDWEIHFERSRSYWKIIRVGGIIEAYQIFEDMLKGFDREDLVALWRLVKEKFSSAVPNVDKEKALWVKLKRSFEPDTDDVLWKLQRYLEDIVDLEEKLSSHDRIVYKMGQSIQTIHMLGKKSNKVYDIFLKAGLGYKNLERLKKAIVAQPKIYDGERLYGAKLTIDSPDSDKTLKDAEESRLKMRNKMVQINIGKLNALYETFVPQQEFSIEQTYFSIPSTSNNGS
nr:hypothetical protein [Tanacetum cinerariifolium]